MLRSRWSELWHCVIAVVLLSIIAFGHGVSASETFYLHIADMGEPDSGNDGMSPSTPFHHFHEFLEVASDNATLCILNEEPVKTMIMFTGENPLTGIVVKGCAGNDGKGRVTLQQVEEMPLLITMAPGLKFENLRFTGPCVFPEVDPNDPNADDPSSLGGDGSLILTMGTSYEDVIIDGCNDIVAMLPFAFMGGSMTNVQFRNMHTSNLTAPTFLHFTFFNMDMKDIVFEDISFEANNVSDLFISIGIASIGSTWEGVTIENVDIHSEGETALIALSAMTGSAFSSWKNVVVEDVAVNMTVDGALIGGSLVSLSLLNLWEDVHVKNAAANFHSDNAFGGISTVFAAIGSVVRRLDMDQARVECHINGIFCISVGSLLELGMVAEDININDVHVMGHVAALFRGTLSNGTAMFEDLTDMFLGGDEEEPYEYVPDPYYEPDEAPENPPPENPPPEDPPEEAGFNPFDDMEFSLPWSEDIEQSITNVAVKNGRVSMMDGVVGIAYGVDLGAFTGGSLEVRNVEMNCEGYVFCSVMGVNVRKTNLTGLEDLVQQVDSITIADVTVNADTTLLGMGSGVDLATNVYSGTIDNVDVSVRGHRRTGLVGGGVLRMTSDVSNVAVTNLALSTVTFGGPFSMNGSVLFDPEELVVHFDFNFLLSVSFSLHVTEDIDFGDMFVLPIAKTANSSGILVSHANLENVHIGNVAIDFNSSVLWDSIRFEESNLNNVTLDEVDIYVVKWKHADVKGIFIDNVDMEDSRFSNVNVEFTKTEAVEEEEPFEPFGPPVEAPNDYYGPEQGVPEAPEGPEEPEVEEPEGEEPEGEEPEGEEPEGEEPEAPEEEEVDPITSFTGIKMRGCDTLLRSTFENVEVKALDADLCSATGIEIGVSVLHKTKFANVMVERTGISECSLIGIYLGDEMGSRQPNYNAETLFDNVRTVDSSSMVTSRREIGQEGSFVILASKDVEYYDHLIFENMDAPEVTFDKNSCGETNFILHFGHRKSPAKGPMIFDGTSFGAPGDISGGCEHAACKAEITLRCDDECGDCSVVTRQMYSESDLVTPAPGTGGPTEDDTGSSPTTTDTTTPSANDAATADEAEDDDSWWIWVIVGSVVGVLVIATIIAVVILVSRNKKRKDSQEGSTTTEMSSSMVSHTGESIYLSLPLLAKRNLREEYGEWLIEPHEIEFGELLGKGSFGEVFRCTVRGQVVAVKVCSSSSETAIDEFLAEAKIMMNLPPHENIIRLVGIAFNKNMFPLLIIELCEGGCLKSLMAERQMSFEEQVKAIAAVARGMQHLAAHGIVHRDLAARNILLTGDGTPKVSDFGMSRILDATQDMGATKQEFGPVRWMAPEAMARQYSTQSDVWSFGCVVYEILSGGLDPYYDFDQDIFALPHEVMHGGLVPGHPEGIPDEMKQLLDHCWKKEPKDRVTFDNICEFLESHYGSIIS